LFALSMPNDSLSPVTAITLSKFLALKNTFVLQYLLSVTVHAELHLLNISLFHFFSSAFFRFRMCFILQFLPRYFELTEQWYMSSDSNNKMRISLLAMQNSQKRKGKVDCTIGEI
jgi:hypothetical protein